MDHSDIYINYNSATVVLSAKYGNESVAIDEKGFIKLPLRSITPWSSYNTLINMYRVSGMHDKASCSDTGTPV